MINYNQAQSITLMFLLRHKSRALFVRLWVRFGIFKLAEQMFWH